MKRGVFQKDLDLEKRHRDAAKMPPRAERRGEVLRLFLFFIPVFPIGQTTEMLEDNGPGKCSFL